VREPECVLAGADSFAERRPSLTDVRLSDVHGDRRDGIRRVGAKRLAQRAEPEPPVRFLAQDADGRERTQQAIERVFVRPGRCGEIVARPRAVSEKIRHSELRRHADRLRQLVCVDQMCQLVGGGHRV